MACSRGRKWSVENKAGTRNWCIIYNRRQGWAISGYGARAMLFTSVKLAREKAGIVDGVVVYYRRSTRPGPRKS